MTAESRREILLVAHNGRADVPVAVRKAAEQFAASGVALRVLEDEAAELGLAGAVERLARGGEVADQVRLHGLGATHEHGRLVVVGLDAHARAGQVRDDDLFLEHAERALFVYVRRAHAVVA